MTHDELPLAFLARYNNPEGSLIIIPKEDSGQLAGSNSRSLIGDWLMVYPLVN